jgi:hypothetical protein
MKLSSLSQLSLLVAMFTLPQIFTPTSDSRLCSLVSLAAEVREIGEHGKDGKLGANGQNGRDSDSLTVFADGSPMTLDLTGEDGLPGTDGSKGGNGVCQELPEDPSKNLQNANGGNGGDGGDGGNGGNGGSLTVYTTDKNYLQQIYIITSGGKGGEPGQGGAGGKGCKCPKTYLNREVCSDNNCTTREFKCQDGYDGRTGRSGRVGREGKLGTLTLINLDKPLTADLPSTTITIGELKDRGITLSRNQWESKTGAASLFAPGSIISDRYKELVNRLEHSVLLVWGASQPVSDFASEEVSLNLIGKEVKISLPEDIWLETTIQKRENITELLVYNAVSAKNVTRLKSQGISGKGTDLRLSLVDEAGQSDLILTDFSLKYRVSKSAGERNYRPLVDYRTQYEGKIPPELIEQNGNNFTLNLGQLPIPPEHLEPGTAIEVRLIANRSFAGKSKEQEITVRDTIPRQ